LRGLDLNQRPLGYELSVSRSAQAYPLLTGHEGCSEITSHQLSQTQFGHKNLARVPLARPAWRALAQWSAKGTRPDRGLQTPVVLLARPRERREQHDGQARPPGRGPEQRRKGWDVTNPGKKEPVSHHKTQTNAEKAAKKDIRPQGGEVVIHGRYGRIRDKDTIPPARDPYPPKDTKH
jgi:hypothetical protein